MPEEEGYPKPDLSEVPQYEPEPEPEPSKPEPSTSAVQPTKPVQQPQQPQQPQQQPKPAQPKQVQQQQPQQSGLGGMLGGIGGMLSGGKPQQQPQKQGPKQPQQQKQQQQQQKPPQQQQTNAQTKPTPQQLQKQIANGAKPSGPPQRQPSKPQEDAQPTTEEKGEKDSLEKESSEVKKGVTFDEEVIENEKKRERSHVNKTRTMRPKEKWEWAFNRILRNIEVGSMLRGDSRHRLLELLEKYFSSMFKFNPLACGA